MKRRATLPLSVREGKDAEEVVVGARREADGRARAPRLRVVHPVDDLPQLVGDLVGRRVLVEVEAVLGDVLPVLDRLDVALLGVEDAVDSLDDVDRDRQAPLRIA